MLRLRTEVDSVLEIKTMSEHTIDGLVEQVRDRFDVEMVEKRDGRTGQAIVDMRGAELDDFEMMYWLEEQEINVTIKSGRYYSDGDIEGTPVTFEIPKGERKFVCRECGEEWDEDEADSDERVGPQEHEFRTDHKVFGL
jgi:hypothetical protein